MSVGAQTALSAALCGRAALARGIFLPGSRVAEAPLSAGTGVSTPRRQWIHSESGRAAGLSVALLTLLLMGRQDRRTSDGQRHSIASYFCARRCFYQLGRSARRSDAVLRVWDLRRARIGAEDASHVCPAALIRGQLLPVSTLGS